MLSTSHALTADYSSWSSGSWSNRLLEAAALARSRPGQVSLCRLAGRRLKILAPRTAKERSLARRTEPGSPLASGSGTA